MSSQALTQSLLQTRVRDLVFEGTSDTGLISSNTELNRWIDQANKAIWLEAAEAQPEMFAVRATATYVAATGYYDYSGTTLDSNGVWKLMYVETLYNNYYYPVDHLGVPQQRFLTEPIVGNVGPNAPPWFYYLEAEKLYFTPNPPSNQTMRLVYVPHLPALSGGSTAIGGKFDDHHDLVALEAATLLYNKDGDKSTPWDDRRAEARARFLKDVGKKQSHQVRRVRTQPY